jgi:hypothetical protein
MIQGAFATVARGLILPAGWGFTPAVMAARQHASTLPAAVALRAILFPTVEQEMLAQLVRWHYGILRSRPHVWRSLAGKYESYEPCNTFKPSIEVDIQGLCPDPVNGYLNVGWKHEGETTGLEGILQMTATANAILKFPGWEGEVPMTLHDAVWRIVWPEWMATYAGLIIPEADALPGLKITFRIRPVRFAQASMIQQVNDTCSRDLQTAGLLDSFISAVNPLDKLAVVWLALAILEEEHDQQSREGDDA